MRFVETHAEALCERLSRLECDDRLPDGGFFRQVTDLVVVASSSRSGSSTFMDILSRSERVLMLRAEINPFLRLCGLDATRSGTDSDQLTEAHAAAAEIRRLEGLVWMDAGIPCHSFTASHEIDRFTRDLARRLLIQWPSETIDPGDVGRWARETLQELYRDHGWKPHRFENEVLFYGLFLRRLRERHPRINPYYYDIPRKALRHFLVGAPPPQGPPSDRIVEEPPFVTVRPWRRVSTEDLAGLPLVIKSPSNAYRLPFLRRLFPNARLRLVHLTRNPAASINGLLDGWCHPGFHAYSFDQPTGIRGLPPLDSHWWKFDLPPDWRGVTGSTLERVCAFQWRSAHGSILDFIDREQVDSFQLRFEEINDDPVDRLRAFRRLFAWLGLECTPEVDQVLLEKPRLTMVTRNPQLRRWRQRASLLEPLLENREMAVLIERLGYTDRSIWS